MQRIHMVTVYHAPARAHAPICACTHTRTHAQTSRSAGKLLASAAFPRKRCEFLHYFLVWK